MPFLVSLVSSVLIPVLVPTDKPTNTNRENEGRPQAFPQVSVEEHGEETAAFLQKDAHASKRACHPPNMLAGDVVGTMILRAAGILHVMSDVAKSQGIFLCLVGSIESLMTAEAWDLQES